MKTLKNTLFALAIVLIGIGTTSCTDNNRAKHWGGSMTITLEKGEKLVDVTWKESNLWYMTKPMSETDVAETYTFREDSNWGMIEGKVIFVETK